MTTTQYHILQYVTPNIYLVSTYKPDTGKFHSSYIGMDVCGSAYENGCVVDGMCATATD